MFERFKTYVTKTGKVTLPMILLIELAAILIFVSVVVDIGKYIVPYALFHIFAVVVLWFASAITSDRPS
ncbi:MAG: hypothetical protein COB37_10740 [Kordiimonadales bacterium]|nr:MAG: hypothetical protein COB37_10740 [Kordiimonadales bacterium]